MYSAQTPLYQPEEITQAAPPVAPEPQIFTHADSVVMILRPKEFYRKKALISGAGAENVQVFSDFEHVMTAFNTNSQVSVGKKFN